MRASHDRERASAVQVPGARVGRRGRLMRPGAQFSHVKSAAEISLVTSSAPRHHDSVRPPLAVARLGSQTAARPGAARMPRKGKPPRRDLLDWSSDDEADPRATLARPRGRRGTVAAARACTASTASTPGSSTATPRRAPRANSPRRARRPDPRGARVRAPELRPRPPAESPPPRRRPPRVVPG